MKAYWKSGSTLRRILNLGTRRVVSFTPRSLYPREINPGINWIGGWVGLKIGLNAVARRKEKSLHCFSR
jgi:hypothetical protein